MQKLFIAGRGGGVKSMTFIGTVQALQEAHLTISGASGSSLASVIATMVALHMPAKEMLEFFRENCEKFVNASIIKGGKGQSVIGNEVKSFCGNMKFKDIDTELYIPANQGSPLLPQRFLFSKATTPDAHLYEAIMASCSFPGLFFPYKYELNGKKYLLTDGGMVDNPYLPIKQDDTLYVVSSFRKKKENMRSLYKDAWLLPKKNADILLNPYIGKMGTLGTSDDVDLAFMIGYNAASKEIQHIISNMS